jgi:hypothetical protein
MLIESRGWYRTSSDPCDERFFSELVIYVTDLFVIFVDAAAPVASFYTLYHESKYSLENNKVAFHTKYLLLLQNHLITIENGYF